MHKDYIYRLNFYIQNTLYSKTRLQQSVGGDQFWFCYKPNITVNSIIRESKIYFAIGINS